MAQGHESEFEHAMSGSNNRDALGRLTLLAWVAACDGSISDKCLLRLHKLVPVDDEAQFELALGVGQKPVPDDLLIACQVVRDMPVKERHAFLGNAILIAVTDGLLTLAANHILRLLAEVSDIDLNMAFKRCTSKEIPEPGDPGSIEWWQASGNGKKRRQKMSTAEALSILGLASESSEKEINQAYRRLAHIHHPDRFSQASGSAQDQAAKTFAKINEAYETLTKK